MPRKPFYRNYDPEVNMPEAKDVLGSWEMHLSHLQKVAGKWHQRQPALTNRKGVILLQDKICFSVAKMTNKDH
ncbi:hypothetical protein HNY73_011487 [Argiope bruennichi]|uniref:Uncharacterized protein n=1 Tax=Argiope bruennichi TaxID=94029 RepID=A0A8T0F6Q5_ARGBR|nr:hypothetical protein HNY73_011487 [Argiope bruennichi]